MKKGNSVSWLLYIFFGITVAWLGWALIFPFLFHGSLRIDFWNSDTYWGNATLGETGDYWAGWLTPLALGWFVVTVLLQHFELRLQRQELSLLRHEYEQSRRAAERQAAALEASKVKGDIEELYRMLHEAKLATAVNARMLLEALPVTEANYRLRSKPDTEIIEEAFLELTKIRDTSDEFKASEKLRELLNDAHRRYHTLEARAHDADIHPLFYDSMKYSRPYAFGVLCGELAERLSR